MTCGSLNRLELHHFLELRGLQASPFRWEMEELTEDTL